MIAVTGASGKLGRIVIEGLLQKVSPEKITAVVRSEEKVRDFSARGVRVRRGDYSSPETLAPALEGTERLLLISSNEVGNRVPQHRAVVDAAKEAGVRLLAYTSILRADKSGLLLADEHKATEADIHASGLPFVFLRNGWYTENYTDNLAMPLSTGVFLGAAGNGRIAAAPRADYAAAAVCVLTEDGHAGKTYELSGDRGFTMAELADAVSTWSGKPVVYRDLPVREFKQALVAAGVPEGFAEVLVNADIGIARGDLDSDSRELNRLIGRDTRTLSDVLSSLSKP